ncbi:universal stress protein [Streptomyces sp. NPDC050095]|uniref:universal stress protein n=1 Tax=unclassified Streptomyces TaxID=2593676 RepID=UPI0034493885
MTRTSRLREAITMLKPIVVGLDGSRESLAAADWAARTALRRGLPLRIVQAWEGSSVPEFAAAQPPDLTAPQYGVRRTLRHALDRITERYPHVYVSAEQLRTPALPGLLSEAEDAELLVLGNRGLSGVSGLFSGSVALAVVARAHLPVVLVRAGVTASDEHRADRKGLPSTRTPCRDVLVAVDAQRPCDGLLAFAFDEAAQRSATLRAVHIWHLPYGTSGLAAADVYDVAQESAQSALDARLRPWQDKHPTVTVRSAAVHARTVHEIVHAAQGAGLLVVGRRPRLAGTGPHTGPVTHAVLHHVTCPVAVVPHD